MRIKWLKRAILDLDEEISYIAQDNPEIAIIMYSYIRNYIKVLENFPDLGRPGRVFGTRELVLDRYPYIIPYRVKNENLEILRIFHTRRKPPRG